MQTRVFLIACLLLPFGVVNAGAAETTMLTPLTLIDIEDAECSTTATMAPEHTEIPVVGDYKTVVNLDVQVILVRVDPQSAVRIMQWVKSLYASINIRVNVFYEAVDLKISETPDTSATGGVISTSQSQAYIDASKAHYGGMRPPHADVVYTMLGGEIAGSVAGQADCVGGVAFDDAAFAVGEARTEDAGWERWSGKIAAHEIAHLLAAHHHYANCAQGKPEDIVAYIQPCTLMFNDVLFISPQFSTLEAAVVRRWALDHLGPNAPKPAPNPEPTPEPEPTPDPDPQPQHDPETFTRSIALEHGDGSLNGTVDSEPDADFCTQDVPVKLQRKRDGKWRTIAAATTDDLSSFTFSVTRVATYRAKAPLVEFDDGDVCSAALSSKVKIR